MKVVEGVDDVTRWLQLTMSQGVGSGLRWVLALQGWRLGGDVDGHAHNELAHRDSFFVRCCP